MKFLSTNPNKPFALSMLALSVLTACGGSDSTTPTPAPTDPEEPVFSATMFNADSANVSNNYFPLKPGTSMVYEGFNDEGELERVEVSISHETRVVDGVESRIVVDRNYTDGELDEETFDWYAQDTNGNVWYMGEDSVEIEDGEVVTSAGSWESGLDIDNVGSLATAGILMKAQPFIVADTYQQEFYPGVAEDMAKIIAIDVNIDLPAVSLADGSMVSEFVTLQTLEWVPLDDDPVSTEEYKYFAPGIGQVLETNTDGGERVELKSIKDDTMPNLSPDNFSKPLLINNPYFPLIPGTTYRFETTEGEDEELILYEVLDETRVVMGITTRVVRDRVYIDGDEFDGILVEDTHDWFAQDDDGNVWYMGEEVDNYDDDGVFTNNDGAWEAGIDGAQPGIQMKAQPLRGDSYHQEYLEGEAEDIAAIVATNAETELDNGMSYSTLKVKEWNPLEEGSTEYKYYAAGIGFVREEKQDEFGEVEEAIEFIDLSISNEFENLFVFAVNDESEDEAQLIIEGSVEPEFFKSLQCYAPNGVKIIDAKVDENSGDYADFQYDTAKTEVDELALSYPAGTYWCIAQTPDDGMMLGSSQLEYAFTDAIEPIFPANGSEDVDITNLTLSWTVPDDAVAITIDIENSLNGDSLEVNLAPDSNSFTLPSGLLASGVEYEVGFETVHENGNISVFEDYSFTAAGDITILEDDSDDDYGDFEGLSLFVVYNATDNDAQLVLEAEAIDDSTMLSMSIHDSAGNLVHEVAFSDEEDLGITDVFYETSEPSLNELQQDFPAGEYTFSAELLNDDDEETEGSGSISLNYSILNAPRLDFPVEDQNDIDSASPLTIRWSNIPENADEIILEIEVDESGASYSLDLSADVTEFTLPAGWLLPNTLYVIDLEVENDEGNITVVDVEFTTLP